MPIYEYKCQGCGKGFSHLHKRLNEPAPPCPECGSPEVKKVFSTFTASVPASHACANADACPAAASSGHQCCAGCCHHNH